MTYQNLTQEHDDNAEEVSSLLLTATKKKYGVLRRAMITVVFLLFLVTTTTTTTIGGNVRKIKHSKKTNANDGGISAALLLSHNQAAPSVYDPSKDFCFKDNDNPGKLCWNSKDESPVGNWGGFPVAVASCGLKCTEYDPSQDYCFTDIDQAGQYCWYPGDRLPVGNWKGGHYS